MKIKNGLTKFLMAVFSVVVLAACTPSNPTPTPTPPTPVPPEYKPTQQTFTNYFNDMSLASYKAVADEYVDAFGQKQQREVYIDNQLDILSDLLIRRLIGVYGPGFATNEVLSTGQSLAFVTYTGQTKTLFSLESYNLIQHPANVLNGTPSWNLAHTNGDLAINASAFAQAYSKGNFEPNSSVSVLNKLTSLNNAVLNWKYSYSATFKASDSVTNATSAYNNFKAQHHAAIKSDLLKIATGKSVNTTINYENELKNVSSLNFESNFANEVVKYIKNNIIGTISVDGDDRFASNSNNRFSTVDDLYKGYSIVTESIVGTTLSTKVSNANLFKSVNFNEVITSANSIAYWNSNAKDYTKVVTTASKSEAVLTKVVFSIDSSNTQIFSKGPLKATVRAYLNSTTTTATGTSSVNITALRTSYTVTLSTSASTKIQKDGRLEIEFENSTGATFSVSLTGYYQ